MRREGFFEESTFAQLEPHQSLIPKCGACGLYKICEHGKMPPSGIGKSKVLIVGESPSQKDDDQGDHMQGAPGHMLEDMLGSFGVNMRTDCTLTNALICRPKKGVIKDNQIGYCRPNLLSTIEKVNPMVIIPLGAAAMKSVIGSIWKEKIGSMQRWVGYHIPTHSWNAWVCPNYSPKMIHWELTKGAKGTAKVFRLFFLKYLKAAFGIQRRPWDDAPNFQKQVSVELSGYDAAEGIAEMIREGKPIAFDYETNMMKPDSEEGKIVCCSVSNGTGTIAFPWQGQPIKAMRELLKSDVPKIASNMKFEHRWTLRKLGFNVRNWLWDTMVAAHVLDNRPEITSIKFQSLINYGAPDYDRKIKGFLKAKPEGSYNQNRVYEADLNELLLYCGLDSLLEWKVANRQRRTMGYA